MAGRFWAMTLAALGLTFAGCGPMVHVATEHECSGCTEINDRVTIALQLRVDALGISITNLGDTAIDVLWDRAVLVDVDGNASAVVHGDPGEAWAAADASGDVSRIPPHSTLDDFVIPIRDVTFDPREGWFVGPLLPVECGPIRCLGYHELVGKTLRLTLALQVEGGERVVEWTLRITDAVKSVRGARPSDPNLH